MKIKYDNMGKITFISHKALYERERPLMLSYRCAYILSRSHPWLSLSSLEKEGSEYFQASIVCKTEGIESPWWSAWHLVGAQKVVAIMILFLWGNSEEVGWASGDGLAGENDWKKG